MFWFGLACTASGLTLGWAVPSLLVVAVMSFQIIAVLYGLWMGGVLAGPDALMWGVSALFLHQGAYLAAVIAATVLRTHKKVGAPSLAEQVDGALHAMDGLIGRIAATAPASRGDAAELGRLIKQMQRTLRDDDALDRLRRDRRRRKVG